MSSRGNPSRLAWHGEDMPSPEPPDDPRFDWVDVTTASDRNPQWIRGACNHLTPEPVHAHPTGELVAWLCPDCDTQLPPEWRSEPAGGQQVWAGQSKRRTHPLHRGKETS